LLTRQLDNSFHDDFEPGNTDLFDRSLDDSEAFNDNEMGQVRIDFSGTFFDRIWVLKSLKIEGYSGDTLRFIFNVQNINEELRATGRDWWQTLVGTGNTQFYN